MSRIAALTGGTGFLGRATIRAFHEKGWRTRILTRRAPDLPELADIEIELVPGDLSDPATLRRLCAGAEAVVHIAGVVKAPTREAFFRANADGTEAAVKAWREAASEARFTLVSSMAARQPDLSHYSASKREGEERLKRLADGGDWRILRPGAIYGAHDEETLKVLKLANMPFQLMLNAPDARVAMINVRDAAAAIAALAEKSGTGATHELTDARIEGYRWDELATTAAKALGRSPRPARLPAFALKTIARIGDAGAAVFGSAETLTSAKAREILHQDWSSSADMQPDPAIWRPSIALESGLEKMAKWAREAKRL